MIMQLSPPEKRPDLASNLPNTKPRRPYIMEYAVLLSLVPPYLPANDPIAQRVKR